MQGLRRALILATAERYVSLTTNFVVLVVAARLLSPADFGIVALGTSIGLAVTALREFVSPVVLIQQPQALTDSDVATSFTLLLLVSVGLGAALLVSAEPIARLYGHPALATYVRVVAAATLIETIVLPVAAVLRRQMRFDVLTTIAASGAVIGGTATLILAARGIGAPSFAWGWLTTTSVMAVMSVIAIGNAACFRPSLGAWRRVLSFGAFAGANAVLHRIYDSVPSLAFGRLLPIDALGLYNRATSLCQLPEKIILGGVSAVVLPALSSHLREGRALKSAYLTGVEHITALYWPALIGLAILAEPIVLVLLGPQWQAMVPLVRIMAIAGLFAFSAELNYPTLVALGAMRDLLMRSFIAWPLSAIILVAAAPFGVMVLASAFLIVVPLQAAISIHFVQRHLPIMWRDIALAARRSAALTAITAAGLVGPIAAAGVPAPVPLPLAGAAVLSGAVAWLAGLWITRHPLRHHLHLARRPPALERVPEAAP